MLVNMMFRPVSNQFQYDTPVDYCPKQVDTITVYCSELENIASKRKIYASESVLRCNDKKNSKIMCSPEPFSREIKEKNKRIPFISSSSANKSHHMGVNIQTTRSMIQLFPAMNSGEPNVSMQSSHKFLADPQKSNHKVGGDSCTWRNDSEIQNNCPARFENKTTIREDDNFLDVQCKPNPWTVQQTDEREVNECAGEYKNLCFCPNLTMDGYDKVMAPFVKRWRDKQRPYEIATNPYTRAKTLQNYELLSRRMQELQQTVTTMKTELGKLFEKYTKLYEQHVRNQNGILIPVLLETEDKINELKSKVSETIELYNEAATVNTNDSLSSANLLAATESSVDTKPKETTGTTLTKMLRRIQLLQAKLKTGHYHQCSSGDQIEQ